MNSTTRCLRNEQGKGNNVCQKEGDSARGAIFSAGGHPISAPAGIVLTAGHMLSFPVRFIDIYYRQSGKSGIGGRHHSELMQVEVEDNVLGDGEHVPSVTNYTICIHEI
jgi:hypothetical protein